MFLIKVVIHTYHFTYQIPSLILPHFSISNHKYIVPGTQRHFFTQKVQVGPEIFFSSGVEHAQFDGSGVGSPVTEEQFADVHSIMRLILKIISTISVFFFGESI